MGFESVKFDFRIIVMPKIGSYSYVSGIVVAFFFPLLISLEVCLVRKDFLILLFSLRSFKTEAVWYDFGFCALEAKSFRR